jgi:hypothetical protein
MPDAGGVRPQAEQKALVCVRAIAQSFSSPALDLAALDLPALDLRARLR